MPHLTRTVVLGPKGRVVIPAEVRRELELAEGDDLLVRVEDRRILLERRADAVARLRGRYAHLQPAERSLVDELIAERREEAQREREELGER